MTSMTNIRVSDLAYCRIQLPDLDLAEQFLNDFGLVTVLRDDERIYLRGSDPTPYCYVVERGPQHFLGFALNAKSRDDLDLLAAGQGAAVEPIDGPGGGWRVRVKEPTGYDVDVVFGRERVQPIEMMRHLLNTGAHPMQRVGQALRLKRNAGATPVKRLAHVVLGSPSVRESVDWFHATLGMISSDEIVAGPEKALMGAFIRVDEGDAYVDHHTVFVSYSANGPGLHHISFEVHDIDALMADHHHLRQLGRYEHAWGIGRHTLGSQIFDYWIDPFGYLHEHWSDTDRFNASTPTSTIDAREGMVTQWGDDAPDRVRHAVRP